MNQETKKLLLKDLRNMSTDIQMGCICKMYSRDEMIRHIEEETEVGEEEARILENYLNK